jgi:hypothetical protein
MAIESWSVTWNTFINIENCMLGDRWHWISISLSDKLIFIYLFLATYPCFTSLFLRLCWTNMKYELSPTYRLHIYTIFLFLWISMKMCTSETQHKTDSLPVFRIISGSKYSLSGGWWRGEIVADDDDDKVRTIVSHRSMWQTNEYWGSLRLHSDFIVRSDHQKLLPQSSGRGGGRVSLLLSARWKGGGGQKIDCHRDTIDGWGWISGPSQAHVQW